MQCAVITASVLPLNNSPTAARLAGALTACTSSVLLGAMLSSGCAALHAGGASLSVHSLQAALLGALASLPLVAIKAYLWSSHGRQQISWVEDWHSQQVRAGAGGACVVGLQPRRARACSGAPAGWCSGSSGGSVAANCVARHGAGRPHCSCLPTLLPVSVGRWSASSRSCTSSTRHRPRRSWPRRCVACPGAWPGGCRSHCRSRCCARLV